MSSLHRLVSGEDDSANESDFENRNHFVDASSESPVPPGLSGRSAVPSGPAAARITART
jgi:hypothetical protein